MALLMLIIACSTAAFYDHRWLRIPNWVCLVGGTGVLAFIVAEPASVDMLRMDHLVAPNVLSALSGALLCGAMLLPFWLRGKSGAGDVKLVAVIGLGLGPINGVSAIFLGSLSACVMVLARLSLGWLKTPLARSSNGSPTGVPMAGHYTMAVFLLCAWAIFS